jgi:ubiquinone biosynthesis protein
MAFKRITRILKIGIVLMRFRIDTLVLSESRSPLLKSLCYFNPFFYLPRKRRSRGQRLRLALETLGPLFVKFGQILSTRADLLPSDIADELALLQDRVAPFPGSIAKRLIEKHLNQKIDTLFYHFCEEPLASASIAQVHAATLHNYEKVVVKVLRPNVRKQIARDLALLRTFAALFERLYPGAKRIRPKDIIEEFALSLASELNLTHEAANASLLKRNLKDCPDVYIPAVYWDYVHTDILVMERISGTSIAQMERLKKDGANLKELAATGLHLFFTQVFEHNFFHADMHPGNIFIADNQYVLVDFGIVGSLSIDDRRYIAENLLAFFKRDYHRVAKLHIDAGWVDSTTRPLELEAAIRAISEPVFGKALKDISIGHLLLQLFQTARRFNMNIQPQLILLQKTLFNMEALSRRLDPDLDLWKTAKPFFERWLKEQVGFKSLFGNLKEKLPLWIENLPEVPGLIYDALQAIKKMDAHVQK